MDSAMLEQHTDDCMRLVRSIEIEISAFESMLLAREIDLSTAGTRRGRTNKTEKTAEECEDKIMMQQLRTQHTRMLEMCRFLDGDRQVLTMLPKLTAQQAANQPRGSIPELLGRLELVSEPAGRVRYGKMSVRAKTVEEEMTRTKKAMHLYSPIAGYRALPGGGALDNLKPRIAPVDEGDEVEDDTISVGEADSAAGLVYGSGAADKDELSGTEMLDAFHRQSSSSANHRRTNLHEPLLEEEEDEEEEEEEGEEEQRHAPWIEHVNKGSAADAHERMGMAFMHVAMSSDEVIDFNTCGCM